MEQKNYKLEIINELLKDRGHARELAKKLNTNHMIVVRKLKNLLNENVVDFKQQGKNKIYFLKKTIEAKSYVLKTENYKLIQLLKKYPSLRLVIEKIQKNKQIKLAILFGSYTKETSTKNSDIDIYLETKNGAIKKEIEKINSKLSVKIGKYNKSSLLIKEIEKNHVIIKGVEEFYEKNEFFD